MLEGKLIYLRPPTIEELEYVRQLWADSETMKDVGGSIHLNDEQAKNWFEMMISPGRGTDCYFLIFNKNDVPVGEISFHRLNPETMSSDLNLKIAANHRGKGYAKDAMIVFLNFYFLDFGGEVIFDDLAIDNIAGQNVLLKFGFIHDQSLSTVYRVKLTKERFLELYEESNTV